jgi:hypothetical protein
MDSLLKSEPDNIKDYCCGIVRRATIDCQSQDGTVTRCNEGGFEMVYDTTPLEMKRHLVSHMVYPWRTPEKIVSIQSEGLLAKQVEVTNFFSEETGPVPVVALVGSFNGASWSVTYGGESGASQIDAAVSTDSLLNALRWCHYRIPPVQQEGKSTSGDVPLAASFAHVKDLLMAAWQVQAHLQPGLGKNKSANDWDMALSKYHSDHCGCDGSPQKNIYHAGDLLRHNDHRLCMVMSGVVAARKDATLQLYPLPMFDCVEGKIDADTGVSRDPFMETYLEKWHMAHDAHRRSCPSKQHADSDTPGSSETVTILKQIRAMLLTLYDRGKPCSEVVADYGDIFRFDLDNFEDKGGNVDEAIAAIEALKVDTVQLGEKSSSHGYWNKSKGRVQLCASDRLQIFIKGAKTKERWERFVQITEGIPAILTKSTFTAARRRLRTDIWDASDGAHGSSSQDYFSFLGTGPRDYIEKKKVLKFLRTEAKCHASETQYWVVWRARQLCFTDFIEKLYKQAEAAQDTDYQFDVGMVLKRRKLTSIPLVIARRGKSMRLVKEGRLRDREWANGSKRSTGMDLFNEKSSKAFVLAQRVMRVAEARHRAAVTSEESEDTEDCSDGSIDHMRICKVCEKASCVCREEPSNAAKGKTSSGLDTGSESDIEPAEGGITTTGMAAQDDNKNTKDHTPESASNDSGIFMTAVWYFEGWSEVTKAWWHVQAACRLENNRMQVTFVGGKEQETEFADIRQCEWSRHRKDDEALHKGTTVIAAYIEGGMSGPEVDAAHRNNWIQATIDSRHQDGTYDIKFDRMHGGRMQRGMHAQNFVVANSRNHKLSDSIDSFSCQLVNKPASPKPVMLGGGGLSSSESGTHASDSSAHSDQSPSQDEDGGPVLRSRRAPRCRYEAGSEVIVYFKKVNTWFHGKVMAGKKHEANRYWILCENGGHYLACIRCILPVAACDPKKTMQLTAKELKNRYSKQGTDREAYPREGIPNPPNGVFDVIAEPQASEGNSSHEETTGDNNTEQGMATSPVISRSERPGLPLFKADGVGGGVTLRSLFLKSVLGAHKVKGYPSYWHFLQLWADTMPVGSTQKIRTHHAPLSTKQLYRNMRAMATGAYINFFGDSRMPFLEQAHKEAFELRIEVTLVREEHTLGPPSAAMVLYRTLEAAQYYLEHYEILALERQFINDAFLELEKECALSGVAACLDHADKEFPKGSNRAPSKEEKMLYSLLLDSCGVSDPYNTWENRKPTNRNLAREKRGDYHSSVLHIQSAKAKIWRLLIRWHRAHPSWDWSHDPKAVLARHVVVRCKQDNETCARIAMGMLKETHNLMVDARFYIQCVRGRGFPIGHFCVRRKTCGPRQKPPPMPPPREPKRPADVPTEAGDLDTEAPPITGKHRSGLHDAMCFICKSQAGEVSPMGSLLSRKACHDCWAKASATVSPGQLWVLQRMPIRDLRSWLLKQAVRHCVQGTANTHSVHLIDALLEQMCFGSALWPFVSHLPSVQLADLVDKCTTMGQAACIAVEVARRITQFKDSTLMMKLKEKYNTLKGASRHNGHVAKAGVRISCSVGGGDASLQTGTIMRQSTTQAGSWEVMFDDGSICLMEANKLVDGIEAYEKAVAGLPPFETAELECPEECRFAHLMHLLVTNSSDEEIAVARKALPAIEPVVLAEQFKADGVQQSPSGLLLSHLIRPGTMTVQGRVKAKSVLRSRANADRNMAMSGATCTEPQTGCLFVQSDSIFKPEIWQVVRMKPSDSTGKQGWVVCSLSANAPQFTFSEDEVMGKINTFETLCHEQQFDTATGPQSHDNCRKALTILQDFISITTKDKQWRKKWKRLRTNCRHVGILTSIVMLEGCRAFNYLPGPMDKKNIEPRKSFMEDAIMQIEYQRHGDALGLPAMQSVHLLRMQHGIEPGTTDQGSIIAFKDKLNSMSVNELALLAVVCFIHFMWGSVRVRGYGRIDKSCKKRVTKMAKKREPKEGSAARHAVPAAPPVTALPCRPKATENIKEIWKALNAAIREKRCNGIPGQGVGSLFNELTHGQASQHETSNSGSQPQDQIGVSDVGDNRPATVDAAAAHNDTSEAEEHAATKDDGSDTQSSSSKKEEDHTAYDAHQEARAMEDMHFQISVPDEVLSRAEGHQNILRTSTIKSVVAWRWCIACGVAPVLTNESQVRDTLKITELMTKVIDDRPEEDMDRQTHFRSQIPRPEDVNCIISKYATATTRSAIRSIKESKLNIIQLKWLLAFEVLMRETHRTEVIGLLMQCQNQLETPIDPAPNATKRWENPYEQVLRAVIKCKTRFNLNFYDVLRLRDIQDWDPEILDFIRITMPDCLPWKKSCSKCRTPVWGRGANKDEWGFYKCCFNWCDIRYLCKKCKNSRVDELDAIHWCQKHAMTWSRHVYSHCVFFPPLFMSGGCQSKCNVVCSLIGTKPMICYFAVQRRNKV